MKTFSDLLAKSICFDIDDIVSNGVADQDFIDKLKEAYSKGWYIIVFSRRGQVETNGNPSLDKSKIVYGIQETCEWFNIPYHQIMVGKPFTSITIDNSAITTEAFSKFIF